MNDYYQNRIISKPDYIGERETVNIKNTWGWLDKKIPLHFVLIFCIFVFGATFFASNETTFLVEAGRVGVAALEPLPSASPDAKNNPEKDSEINFVSLPVSNNKAYELPLSPNKEEQKKDQQKLRSVISKLDQSDYPEVKINRDDYKDGKYIEVDITKQIMMIYNNGQLTGLYKVSTGMPGMRTPIGSFKIMKKSATYWSNACKCWMPYAMQFTEKGIFIHELPIYPGLGREGENHLGYPVSHGCVRLGIGDAEEVFEFAEVGTPVIVHK